jgi:hypothetical protein
MSAWFAFSIAMVGVAVDVVPGCTKSAASKRAPADAPTLAAEELASPENCKGWKAEWSACSSNSACVVIASPCGWPVAASNRTHAGDATTCNRHAGAAMDCPAWDEARDGRWVVVCAAGQCRTKRAK